MNIESTKNITTDNSIVMIVYGKHGCGKTTFAATSKKPLLIDFENGSKFLGQRGFECYVSRMDSWFTDSDFDWLRKNINRYDTYIIDPLGEAMEKLLCCNALNTKKYRQGDGSLSVAGWGEAKRRMKEMIKFFRDSKKNLIIVSHVSEVTENEQINYRIQVQTKLKDEIPTMVDIISYMGVQKIQDNHVRILYTPAQGGNFDSKDRMGRMPEKVIVSEHNGWEDMISSMKPINLPDEKAQSVVSPVVEEKQEHVSDTPKEKAVEKAQKLSSEYQIKCQTLMEYVDSSNLPESVSIFITKCVDLNVDEIVINRVTEICKDFYDSGVLQRTELLDVVYDVLCLRIPEQKEKIDNLLVSAEKVKNEDERFYKAIAFLTGLVK